MSTFEAINFFNSFAYSVHQAALEQKFYFNAPLSLRRARRARRSPAAAGPFSGVASSSPSTTGGVFEEDTVMSDCGPSSASVPCSLPSPSPPSKRIRLSPPPSTTRCTTTAFWCASDFNEVVEAEKSRVRSFFTECSTTACLSVSGVSVSVSLARDEETMRRLEGIAREILSLGVAAASSRGLKKRSFGDVW